MKISNRKGLAISKTILVVDDDEAIRVLCSEVLGLAGYRVVTAFNGKEALEMLSNMIFDLVISDIDMPELDGVSFYLYALNDYPYIKERFMFMSGSNNGDVDPVLARMEVKCISKPFSIYQFLSSVDNVILKSVDAASRWRASGKRVDERYNMTAECDLLEQGGEGMRLVSARIRDMSRSGIKLRYTGSPLGADKQVSVCMNINCQDLKRCAQVVWSRQINNEVQEAGLRFNEPMPASSLRGFYSIKQHRS